MFFKGTDKIKYITVHIGTAGYPSATIKRGYTERHYKLRESDIVRIDCLLSKYVGGGMFFDVGCGEVQVFF